eukprot:5129326-Lingulodinium_polyedra.AAC.1
MAAAMFMQYHVKLRMIGIMDIFHREWNDVSLALQRAGCWSAVLLSTLAFNVPFGPWDGSAWWEKMKESAQDMQARDPWGGPLFEALYEGICSDTGSFAPGTEEHKRSLLQSLSTSDGFLQKGPHVALKRWFSWFAAAAWHDKCWHSRLLAMAHLAVKAGIYKAAWECPFLGGPEVSSQPPA